MAQGEYLIFIDGDCVVPPNFVARHAQLAKAGWFVAGNRILLNERFTHQVLTQKIPLHRYSGLQWFNACIKRHINRLAPVFTLPLGPIRQWSKHRWQGVKTCNLGVWRKDFIRVNGLDENFVGWGLEDSDLVIRLLHAGVFRKLGKFAVPLFHLWHTTQTRAQLDANLQRLRDTQATRRIRALQGIEQYIHEQHD